MSVVYFMQSPDGGPIKIGTTGDLKERHYGLESLYGTRLVILATIEGDREKEREIHDRFAHLRLGRTEQFRPEADLMEFIGQPSFAEADPASVKVMPVRVLPIALSMKGTKEWRTWLNGYAKHKGMTASEAIDDAILSYAIETGYELPPCRTKDEDEPPPDRTGEDDAK